MKALEAVRRWLDQVLRERDPATMVLCFAVASLPTALVLWVLQGWALAHPEVASAYRPGGLLLSQALLSLLLVWLLAVAWMATRRAAQVRQAADAWRRGVLLPVAAVWLVLALGHGIKDAATSMLLVELVALARALFPWRAIRSWLLMAPVVAVLHEVGVHQAWFDYAPMLSAPIHQGPQLLPWWAVWQRVVFDLAVLPFAALIFLVFGSLDRQRAELESLVRTDVLTGLSNRREFMARLQQEAHRQQRQGHALTVVMIDIDHFKRVNDEWGHPAGDHVLMHLGGVLRGCLRPGVDLAARMGGEEFALLLPESDSLGGQRMARRVSEVLARSDLRWQGRPLTVTISAGVAEVAPGQAERALVEADRNLYQAKHLGRNRTVASSSNAPLRP